MKTLPYDIVYLIGIGGIGMSALARWFSHQGYAVYGYDRTETELTDRLQQEGIEIHFRDIVEEIPYEVKNNIKGTLVIYTPAIPKDHAGFAYLKERGFTIQKRSQVLGLLTENKFTVAVAGTHGKTTTSTMIAHILNFSGKNCDAFLGGISNNLNTNLLIGEEGKEGVMVVEADEYDRSFLTLHPNVAVVTAADADHLDIYGDKGALNQSFTDFISQLAPNGILIVKEGLESLLPDGKTGLHIISYALEKGDVKAGNIRIEKDIFKFDYVSIDSTIKDIPLKVPGFHNVENALAACTVALKLGIDEDTVRNALEHFTGVKRRFEYITRGEDMIYIDDYAHHPVEIEAFLSSVRALYPRKKLTAVFQPHLFSRTRDFLQEFAKSLSLADQVFLLDIYPARELPIAGVTSASLLTLITAQQKALVSKDDLLKSLKEEKPGLLVTVGAGDIDKLVQPIKEVLAAEYGLE